MKRYLLFAGNIYRLLGGINDLVASSDDVQDLMDIVNHRWDAMDSWWHIFDTEKWEIVEEGKISTL